MKLPTLILTLYVSYSTSLLVDDQKKIIVKTYPKKVERGFYQINDSKYFKLQPTKTTAIDKGYTVFSKVFPNVDIGGDHLQIVPDSPYFPVETPLPGQQIRVKKVLTDYAVRHKRDVQNADAEEKTLEKSKSVRKPNTEKKRRRKILKAGSKKHKRTNKRVQNLIIKKNGTKIKAQFNINNARNPQRSKHRHLKLKVTKSALKKENKEGKKKDQTKTARSKIRKDARRLIAGRDALIEQYPYVISIQKGGQHWCAGALLNPRLGITTANCMWRSNRVSKMRIRAGSRHTNRGGQTARIQEVMKHPGWKIRRNPDNDVALILLDRNIRFSNSLHSVDLPNRAMLPAFDDAWITSWGAERRDGVYDPHGLSLQVYHARFMDNQKCNNITQRFGVSVTENFFCLAQTARRAPCTRDTGAPAVSDGVLWGLASWGIRKLCGTERFPAMFSYVGSHSNIDFITNATYQLMSDQRFYPFADRLPAQRAGLTTEGIQQ